VIFAGVVFAVIVGGLKSIAKVTEKVVPFMGIMYVLAALIILLINADKIGWAFGQIFTGAATGNYITEGGRIVTATGASGVGLTSAAFESAISWFPYVLAVAVVLFAFSTMISWSYYGLKAWTYLFGEGKNKEITFKVIFCIFVVIGAAANLGPVIDFSDAAIFAMAVVNISGLYCLMPIVKRELNSYMDRLKSGEIKKFK